MYLYVYVVGPYFQCIYMNASHSVEWIYWFQGMVILAANQVWWTWEVEDTFLKVKKGDKMGLKNYSRKLHAQIGEVVVKVRT